MHYDNRPRPSTIGAVLIVAIGAVLMTGKIYADSEPGLLPLLLVAFGTGWYVIARVRARPYKQPR